MRHGKRFNHLSRTSAHRKAMLSNMACSLIMHKRIKTTVAKAKALRTYVEPLITKAKTDSTHSRRVVFSYLNDKEAVTELFREISVKVADREGGYTRIIKIGARLGDNAEMALIELVDYNENLLSEKAKGTKKTRRRRGGSGKKQETEAAVDTVVEETVETADETVVEAEEKVEEKVEEPKEDAKVEEPDTEAKVDEPAASEQEPEAEEKAEEVKEEPKKDVKAEEPAPAENAAEEPAATDQKPEAEEDDAKKE